MKKLAMLLALCLLITMLPGVGYSEYEQPADENEAPAGDELASNEGLEDAPELDIEMEEIPEDLLIDGEDELLLMMDEEQDQTQGIDAAIDETGETADIPGAEDQTGETPETGEEQDETPLEETGYGPEPHVDPNGPRLNSNMLTLGVGEIYALEPSLPNGAEGAMRFDSSDAGVAEVSQAGDVTAAAVGFACVRAFAEDGAYSECFVSVKKAPDMVSFNTKAVTIEKGDTYKALRVIVGSKAGEYAGRYALESSDTEVATVDEMGVIRAVNAGQADIRVTTYNGQTATCAVVVANSPEDLEFTVDQIRLGVGMKIDADALVYNNTGTDLTFIIQDSGIASCSKGVLKGKKTGNTLLTVVAENGQTADCEVVVVEAPKSVKLPYKKLNIGVKQSVKLEPDVGDSASTFTYSTSNKKIVKVSKDGTITGVKKGKATITIKTYNKKKFKLEVKVVKAPSSIKLSPSSLKMEVGETQQLTYTFPKDTAAAVTFESSDASVADVDIDTGLVTGIAPGKAEITATTSNGKKAKVTVKVVASTKWIKLKEDNIEVGVGQEYPLVVEQSPDSNLKLSFKSENMSVATVSKSGVVTGVGEGTTTLVITTNVPDVGTEGFVTVRPAPDSVTLAISTLTLDAGETYQIDPIIPAGTAAGFKFSTSDKSVAKVSTDGLVTAVSKGTAEITVKTHNNHTATLLLTVLDPYYPESAKITNAPTSMKVGEKLQLKWKVKPENALPDFEWKTSNEDIAYVDDSGVLHAVGIGYATITATSKRNPSIVLNFKVTVEMENVTLTIPKRITGTSEISSNLKLIDDIRLSAIGQIDAMKSDGTISSSDASKRKNIINNAFADYSFPWMTLKLQKYWKKENSEGGAKDFKKGVVYYGVPYISGGGSNRSYNVDKLLIENRYYDSGKGYYILNQDKLLKKKYCGNDCSCFVDAAIWGTNSSHSTDRTDDIAKSSAYKTISDYDDLRTGDLICKGGNHVVMFLYFVNAEKSKIMIIENGGIEPATNTVHCMVMNVQWYTSRGYKVRRLKSLG